MKTNITLLSLLITMIVNAQTHRFIYDVEHRKDSASALTTKENYHLDISGDEIMYYSRDYFIADSLSKNDIPFPDGLKLNASNIIWHKKGSSNFKEYDLLESTVLSLQTVDDQKWKLTGNRKTVNNLTLQEAMAHWGDRNWTAWFTAEIPFQEGPYKFHGLPGLIIEIADDQDHYRFSLVRSENLAETADDPLMEYAMKIGVPVTWEKYKSTKLKYYESPVSFLKNAKGNSGNRDFFLNDGTVVSSDNSREINARLRKTIKNYNNPIERDKAIGYP